MSAKETLQSVFDLSFDGISHAVEGFSPQLAPREVGRVTSVSTGIAKVSGLPGVGFEELLLFPGGVFGIAFNVDEEDIGVILLGEYQDLEAGDEPGGFGIINLTKRLRMLYGDKFELTIDDEGELFTAFLKIPL